MQMQPNGQLKVYLVVRGPAGMVGQDISVAEVVIDLPSPRNTLDDHAPVQTLRVDLKWDSERGMWAGTHSFSTTPLSDGSHNSSPAQRHRSGGSPTTLQG